jgi:hypothetical protein
LIPPAAFVRAFVRAAVRCAAGFALLAAMQAQAGDPPAAARVEARSEDLLAVGIAHGDRMSIHVTQTNDNAPVQGAVLTVRLRGVVHPTIAEADGSYTLKTPDLGLPGPASLELQVTQGDMHHELTGTLLVAAGEAVAEEKKNGTRQLWWWVLNFSVCIGFLMLISRRRKAARQE